MPSRRFAVALAAVVLLSGCSMIPGQGGGSDRTTIAEAPDHHEFVFGSDTGGNEFEAAVTIAKDGSVLHEQTVESDGNGTYVELATVEESGPYTVTVNTTIPGVGGGNMSERLTADGTLGNATAVRMTYQDIRLSSYRLPRRQLEHPLGVYSAYSGGADRASVDLRLEYRGEEVVSKSEAVESNRLVRFAGLNGTGVYHVSVRAEEDGWTNETVVVANPSNHIYVSVNNRGELRSVEVRPPFRWNN